MTSTIAPTPREVSLSLVDGVAKLVAGDESQVDRLAGLYAEQTHVVYWGAPDEPFRSRDELCAHFARVPARFSAPRFRGFRADNIRVHETGDPELIVAEFTYVGDGDGDEPPMNLPCCFVFRVRDGEIVGSRDYVLGAG